jgi:hypothetical protein
MGYLIREIAGWALVVVGLVAFYRAYELLLGKRVFEASPMVFIGFIIFRGGIHLLKVAVAAQAARDVPEAATRPTPRRGPGFGSHPVGPTPASRVLPGPKSAGRSTKR